MSRVQYSKMYARESSHRSLVKALTFRALILTADSVIVYWITKKLDVALGVMIFSNLSSTILYLFHERIWNKVSWGRVKVTQQ